jgi:hypothetical protein
VSNSSVHSSTHGDDRGDISGMSLLVLIELLSSSLLSLELTRHTHTCGVCTPVEVVRTRCRTLVLLVGMCGFAGSHGLLAIGRLVKRKLDVGDCQRKIDTLTCFAFSPFPSSLLFTPPLPSFSSLLLFSLLSCSSQQPFLSLFFRPRYERKRFLSAPRTALCSAGVGCSASTWIG